ncbi:MAG: hypothetical protein BWY09_02337 [Candidatus Hydrogenedentes bacterium ADurb.Bin179]|nr:MAG: hypothetical protein BWY09_02337 [Candidatus Hydrogenedentes bacterium ADurb.Bin179]
MTGRLLKQPWLILTLLGFTIVFAASVYDARRESTVIRQVRRAGIPLSVKELKEKYSPEPWEQNGAKFYLEAMTKYRDPELSTWEHLVIAGDLEYEYGHSFANEQRDALRAYVAANAETIGLILKAQQCPFTRLPGSRYDIYDNTLRKSRDLARLVACAALDAALSGDTETMGEMIEAGLRLHEIMFEGGLLIDALVAKSICTIVFESLEHCLYYARPPSDVIYTWLRGLDTNVYTTHHWMGEIFKNETTLYYQMFEFEGLFFDFPTRLYWQRTLLNLVLEGTQYNYFIQNGFVLGMNTVIAASKKNICDLGITPEEKLIDAWWAGNSRNSYGVFYGFSNNIRAHIIAGINVAQAATARAALASLLYLEDHGKMPETLEALTPGYLLLPAYDPFTQNALLRYRVDDGQAVFYSVGPNKKDDGGKEAERGKSVYEDGDIFFRLPLLEADSNL